MGWLCLSNLSRLFKRSKLPNIEKRQVSLHSRNCLICKELILAAVTTDCNHSFCELCFYRSITKVDQCPECTLLRPHFHRNTELDRAVKEALPDREKATLRTRRNQRNFARRIIAIDVGMSLDFQDKPGRWRRGSIKQIIAQRKAASLLWIRVEESGENGEVNVVDELIEQTSLRIAPLGFITGEDRTLTTPLPTSYF
jgi:hypothetical protein